MLSLYAPMLYVYKYRASCLLGIPKLSSSPLLHLVPHWSLSLQLLPYLWAYPFGLRTYDLTALRKLQSSPASEIITFIVALDCYLFQEQIG
jgi:hypothetical protein